MFFPCEISDRKSTVLSSAREQNHHSQKFRRSEISHDTGTLSAVYLTHNKFGLNIQPPSLKFTQCQVVQRNALKTSPNEAIKELWRSTNNGKNVQYDVYSSTKEILRDFRSNQENKLQNHLHFQGSFFSHVQQFSNQQLNKVWSIAQSQLPKNIFNFTMRYINNSLPTRKNLKRWGITSTSDCSFCLRPETLLHVVAGCQQYLERYAWRNDSILNFFATILQTVNNCEIFVDLAGFKNPTMITGDAYRPDLLLTTPNRSLYIVELTVGFESNLKNNVNRKKSQILGTH